MENYLMEFKTTAEYNEYINGSGSVLPNVSICDDSTVVYYNPVQASNEIWYTTASKNIIDIEERNRILASYGAEYDGPEIISNTYKKNKGVIKFSDDITKIGLWKDGEVYKQCCLFVNIKNVGLGHDLLTISLPTSITNIESFEHSEYGNIGEFSECHNLSEIKLTENLTSIGDYTFDGCIFERKKFINESSATGFPWKAFLYDIEINGMYIDGAKLVKAKDGLTSVSIPNMVETIGEGVFENYLSLTGLEISNSVTSILDDAFNGCENISEIHCLGTVPPTIGNRVFDNTNECDIYVPGGTLSVYKEAWPQYANRIKVPQNIIYYTSTDGEIVEPSTYSGFGAAIKSNTYVNGIGAMQFDGPIDTIPARSFFLNARLKTVEIPDTVITIDKYAFEECQNLTGVTIPNSVQTISELSFGFSGIKKLTIPESVYSIGRNALNINSLEELTFLRTSPAGYDSSCISYGAYYYVPDGYLNAYNIKFPSFKEYFYEISSKSITYTSIDGEIVEPNTYSGFGGNIVSNTYVDGVGKITFDKPVQIIPENAFANKGTLKTVTLWSNVHSIKNSAFKNCNNLTSVNIPSKVTEIENNTFENCYSLVSINLNNVKTVGNSAFKNAGLNNIILGEKVLTVGESVFENCLNLTAATLSSNIETIGKSAFKYSGILSITIPSNVTSIPESLCERCENLTEINFNNTIYIGDNAFRECYSLNSITIPSTVKSIGNNAFTDSMNVTALTISDGVEHIGNGAFMNCRFSTVEIPNSVNSIGDSIFMSCYNLSEVILPSGLTSITEGMFGWCENLKDITIPEGVTTINARSFSNCLSLSSITIPHSVIEIGEEAYKACSSITKLIIPNTVEMIRMRAFEDCVGLQSIQCLRGVPFFSESFIFDNTNECPIYVSLESEEIYKNALHRYRDRIIGGQPYNEIRYSVKETEHGPLEINNGVLNCKVLSNEYSEEVGMYIVTCDDKITQINDYLFSHNAWDVNKITLPNSITILGNNALNGLGVDELIIPSSIEILRDNSLAVDTHSDNLIAFKFLRTTPPEISDYTFPDAYMEGDKYVIEVPLDSYDLYMNQFGRYSGQIVNKPYKENEIWYTTTNGERLDQYIYDRFDKAPISEVYNNGLGKIIFDKENIPSAITEYGFSHSQNLKTFLTSSGMSLYVGNCAFEECRGLEKVSFGKNSEYGNYVFNGCISLETADLSDMRIIPEGMFRYCSSLHFVNFYDVEEIGNQAFLGCSSLSTVEISDNIRSVGEMAFVECENINYFKFAGVYPIEYTDRMLDNGNNCDIKVPMYGITNYKESWKDVAERIKTF